MDNAKSADSKIIKKIRNLLALGGNNSNMHEARQAILKAHKLMADHGIQSVSVDEAISHSIEKCDHPGNRHFRKPLAAILAPNFRCKVVLLQNRIAFIGRSTDAQIAKEIFEFAYQFAYGQIKALLKDMRENYLAVNGITDSYSIGFLTGLKEQLDAQSTALMVVVPSDVEKEFEDCRARHKTRNSSAAIRISHDDYMRSVHDKGMDDGRSVINRRRLDNAG